MEWGGQLSQVSTPPSLTINEQEIYRLRRRLHVETAQSALMVILKLVISGLTCIILIVLSVVNLQGSLFSYL